LPNGAELVAEAEAIEEGPSPVRPFWSGTISFGLVSIPVDLYPAVRSHRFGLRTLSADGTPVRRRYFSSKSDHELNNEQLIRGYELDDRRYAVVTDEELERLAPEQSRDIDLRLFVSEDAIPPQYFEKAYFLIPGEGKSTKAYRLLGSVLQKTGHLGIGTFVMRGQEYLAAILSKNGVLCAETLRFADELRSPADVGLPEIPEAETRSVKEFANVIKKESKPSLALTEMHDEVTQHLLDIVKRKQADRENVVTDVQEAEETEPKVISILDVLKRSLSEAKPAKQPPKREDKRVAARGAEPATEKIPPRTVRRKTGSRKAEKAA
jgi:DNA end-binding protein Ku